MPLPKSLQQPFRRNTLIVGSGWRAFFAPFNTTLSIGSNDTTQGPKILDMQKDGPFTDTNLPSGWRDLGWIKDFRPAPGSKIGQVKSGYRGAVRAQYRGEVQESFEFKFREMTRMALKIATGCEIFNLLNNAVASIVGPVSGSGAQTVGLGASGYQANGAGGTAGSPTVFVPAGSGTLFSAGEYIVVDQDYNGTDYGQVSDAGIPVFQSAVVDPDFIRKTSDYVARIASINLNPGVAGSQQALVLDQPFVGGGNAASGTPNTAPTTGAKIQKIKGFAAREGGTFITEWSALFLMNTIDGAQIAYYYPHCSIAQFRELAPWAIANIGNTDLSGYELDTVMEALAFDDPIDGETVVAYRAFYPGGRSQNIAI